MSEQLDAVRRELREALTVARASLAQVRRRPVPEMNPEGQAPDRQPIVPDGDA